MSRNKPKKPPQEQLGHRKAELANVEVENPMFSRDHPADRTNPLRVRATINVRESPLGYLAAKKLLTDAQLRAASKFRQLWEAAGTSVRAMDYSIDPVDGGGIADPISERQMNAHFELRNLTVSRSGRAAPISVRHYEILRRVIGEGTDIPSLATTRSERDVITAYLKHALEDLASYWGFQSEQRKAS